ncbi:divergent polysaccharide deacetylase family protein [Alloyangia pacifica]|uniref:divergent polysaccharide deacetylase family protein n=1 Tax=Alloyangia pacifica TaxID=311180 RepID=UPI001CD4A0EA|nr:divergent polysaccharide deacetylase family protein [Alloyangia pacifica]MCA0996405.1 divergent polysaccharide deacetylase family protein [Alloyangia pacifica]
MARGFLAGAIWGLVVSGVGLAAISVAVGPPANRPTPPSVAEAEEAETGDVAVSDSAEMPAPQDLEAPLESAQDQSPSEQPPVETPEPADDAPAEAEAAASETPAELPIQSAEEAAPESEGAAEEAEPQPVTPPARRPSEERGVEAASAGPSLAAPGLAEGSAPDTQPSQRPEPIPAPQAPDAPGTSEAARLAVRGDAPVQPGLPTLPPEAPLAEAQPAVSTDPAQPPQPAEDSGLAAEPEPAPDAVSEAPEMDKSPLPEAEPEKPRVTVLTPERSETPETAPQEDRPAIGTPADTLVGREGAVPQSRLPVVSDAEEAPDTTAPAPQDSPLYRYAAATDLPAGEPALSIVLIDDGSGPLGPEAVEAFPFPVSFAISADHPDAAAAAAAYRARGFEVLALSDLPENATPADTEVALEGALGAVPEAIGVLEGPDLGLHQSREIGTQAAQFLRDTGHGLLLMANGLNTAEALARREGVPALTVFRDFDGKGQDPRVMRRFLDQAAFKARQEEGVVMLGRLRADTVSALLLWGLQDRANSVALVPVSALLQRQQNDG